MTPTMTRVRRLPPHQFFWAVIDAPGWTRSGPVPAGLGALVEDEFPVAIDGLGAVCAPISGGRVLVCAARAADLDAHADALALGPESLPPFAAGLIDPAAFNLLVGPHEPRPLRRARRRAWGVVAGTVVACAAFLVLGLERRTQFWLAHAETHRGAAGALVRSALPGEGAPAPAVELERLRAAAAARARATPTDAARLLAAVLDGWPRATAATVHSIAVDPQGATLALTLDGDPSEFLGALRPPPGWVQDEPRINSTEVGTRVSLRLRPREDAP